MKINEIIDMMAGATAPVAAWVAFGQSINKPWAHSGFIVLGAVSVGAWVVKNLIQAKKKNARLHPKRSKKENTSKQSISHKQMKIKYEYYKNLPPPVRLGQGFGNSYKKQDVMIHPNSRRR